MILGAKPFFMNLDCGMCGASTCDDAKAPDALGIRFAVSSKNVFFDRR